MSATVPKFSAAYMPHSDNVIFYADGWDMGVMRWTDRRLFVVRGSRPHLRLWDVRDAYLKDRTEPGDMKEIVLP